MNKHLEQAIIFHRQGKLDEAEKHYLQGLSDDFDSTDGLYLLGTLYLQQHKIGLSANLFKQALSLKKDHFECWNNLGNCYKAVNKDTDAGVCFEMAINISGKGNNDYADIHNNLATLYINAGCPEQGMPHVLKALELIKDHKDASWNLALLYLEQGIFGKGFDLYHWGFKTSNRIYRDYGYEIPYWDGSPGKKIVVWGEQGIGDEIMFASMLPDLIRDSREVIFECHPRLTDIFKVSFPDITIYPTRKDSFIEWPNKHPDIEAKVAIGDLAKYYRRSVEDFSKHTGYLRAPEGRVEYYRQKLAKLGSKPKIGISWTGGYVKTRKDYRSVSLDQWESIFKLDVDFISMQYTSDAYNQIAEIEDRFDIRIHHWPSAVQNPNYAETAALTSALDLVITVNTSIHHLTGALGKDCWTLTPKAKAWRYWSADGVNNPWYPSVRQYQQENLNDWKQIIESVTKDLGEYACALHT